MSKDTQANKYQLTINNPSDYGYTHEKILESLIGNFKTLEYVCMADEQGNTFHTHIFVCFTSRVRFSKVKKHFPEAHIEKCKGTVSENISYVKKDNKWEKDIKHGTQIEGTFKEYGTRPPDSKGKNFDMTELYQMVADGMTNAEILAENQDYILQIDKLDKLRTILLTEKYKNCRRLNIKITYISGATRTGKTRSVLDKHSDSQVYRVTDYKHPFDGYQCQPVILFDEFRSSLKISEMLDYLDIYPLELPARYANKYACYETVYIISNWKLEEQYREAQKDDLESWNAFLARFNSIEIFNKDGTIDIYNSVADYMNREEKFHPATLPEDTDNPFI